MFNLGNDDKEKLKENMEEIKSMVERSAGKQVEEKQSAEEPNVQKFDEGLESQATGKNEKETSNFEDQNQQDINQEDLEGSIDDELLDEFDDEVEKDETDSLESGLENNVETEEIEKQDSSINKESKESRKKSKSREKSRPSSSLQSEIPEPPETREIDVPEIEKGPLFIRRQKFNKAKQMINDMKYISRELQTTMNDLESGISQDQGIESDLREMLHEFENSRDQVQSIISPKED